MAKESPQSNGVKCWQLEIGKLPYSSKFQRDILLGHQENMLIRYAEWFGVLHIS